MLTLTIVWLALIDSINPTIIAITFVLLLYRGVRAIWAYTFSVFATTVFQAFALYFGLDKLLKQTSWDNLFLGGWILIIVGGGILVYGLNSWKNRHQMPNMKKWHSVSSLGRFSYIKYIIVGCATTLVETPTAFLLFIAVLEVQKFNVNPIFTTFYFCLYSLVYTLPVILITVISTWQEKQLKKWLISRINMIYIRMNIFLSLSLIALGIVIFATGIRVLIF